MSNLDKVIENGHERGLLIRSKMLTKIWSRIFCGRGIAVCPKCNQSFEFYKDDSDHRHKINVTCPYCGKTFRVE